MDVLVVPIGSASELSHRMESSLFAFFERNDRL